MIDKITAVKEIVSSVASDGMKAVASSDMATAAGKMATSAVSEIGSAASSMAKVGSKWAYVWMAQRMAQQVLSTVVSMTVIICIAYVVIFFLGRFLKGIKSVWKSEEFVSKVARNIKSQIAIDHTHLLESVSRSKDTVGIDIDSLRRKIQNLADVQRKYKFEPLAKQLNDILLTYKDVVNEFRERVAAYERRMLLMEDRVRGLNAKRNKKHI